MKPEKPGSFRETETTGHFVLPVTEQKLMEDKLQTTNILSNRLFAECFKSEVRRTFSAL